MLAKASNEERYHPLKALYHSRYSTLTGLWIGAVAPHFFPVVGTILLHYRPKVIACKLQIPRRVERGVPRDPVVRVGYEGDRNAHH